MKGDSTSICSATCSPGSDLTGTCKCCVASMLVLLALHICGYRAVLQLLLQEIIYSLGAGSPGSSGRMSVVSACLSWRS